MTNKHVCGKCGGELTDVGAEQLCPGCLLEAGLDAGPDSSRPSLIGPAGQSPIERSFPRSFGDYELLEEIAHGGMGIVYKARQVSLDRIVAVKMLLFGPLAGPEFVQRFRTEAAAAASLQHPNIVAIHEVGFREGQHFFAMDYVAGRSLADITRDGPLRPRRAARYVKTIAEAIQYAHERGILHRDLKPSNVLINEFDQPRVTEVSWPPPAVTVVWSSMTWLADRSSRVSENTRWLFIAWRSVTTTKPSLRPVGTARSSFGISPRCNWRSLCEVTKARLWESRSAVMGV